MLRHTSHGGFKRAPLALSLGYGGATTTGVGTTVVIQHLPRSARRAQLHLVNRNPRYARSESPAVSIDATAIGLHDGAGGSDAWTSFPNDGETEYVSGWIDVPQAWRGKEIAVRYRWSSSDSVQKNIGTAWTNGRRNDTPPLFAWLELEVPTSALVVAAFGDSLSCGVSSSRPVVDSWIDQWARLHDAVPVHWSHSGDKALGWPDTAERKWALYGPSVSAPDALVFFMGSNDLAERAPSAWDMQMRIIRAVDQIRSRLTSDIYGATILPRTNALPGSTFETVRREINAWLPRSGLFHDVFDFAAAISDDDETILPDFDADGVHLNTAGYGALAAVIGRPLMEKAGSGAAGAVELSHRAASPHEPHREG